MSRSGMLCDHADLELHDKTNESDQKWGVLEEQFLHVPCASGMENTKHGQFPGGPHI